MLLFLEDGVVLVVLRWRVSAWTTAFRFFLFFSGGNDDEGIKKYMLPRLSSVSGERIRIRRTTAPWEVGLLRTWLGLALRTSPAVMGRVISSTYPFKCTIRIKSSAPHGRIHATQHLKLLPILNTKKKKGCRKTDQSFVLFWVFGRTLWTGKGVTMWDELGIYSNNRTRIMQLRSGLDLII